MMNHQSGDIKITKHIDAYVKGQLSEQEKEELWINLLKNQEHFELLETELALKSILEEKQGQAGGSAGGAVSDLQQSWKWIAAAASVAILVIAINFFKLDGSLPITEQAIDNINMTNNLAAPMVMRSQKSTLSEADSLMNVGFEAALSGDIARALQVYEEVIRQFDQTHVAARAHLNIGIIKYNDSEFETASQSFQQTLAIAEDDKVLREKANWYLGNAYINLDSLEQARGTIQKVYDLDGTYRKPAFRLLKKLDYELGNIDFNNTEEGQLQN